MYMNNKLRENIVNALSSNIKTDVSQKYLSSLIDTASVNTWKELSLSERCGPPLWDFLLWMASVADAENKPDLYLRALSIVQEGHPCSEVCRPHMKSNLQIVNPKDYSSCKDHCVSLHNLVNKQLSKAQYPHDKAIDKVDLGCDSCTFNPIRKSHHRDDTAGKKHSKISSSRPKTSDNQSTIYYPASYRARNTSSTGVYTSRRSLADH